MSGSPSVNSRFSSPSIEVGLRGPMSLASPANLDDAKDLIEELTDRLELANSDRLENFNAIKNSCISRTFLFLLP